MQQNFASLKSHISTSFDVTLSKIDSFFKASDIREAQQHEYCKQARIKEIQSEKIIDDFAYVRKDFLELKNEVAGFSAIKNLAKRLIFRLNRLGFDDMSSLNLSRKIIWAPNFDPIKSRLLLVDEWSTPCLPLPLAVSTVETEARVISPKTTLLVPGAKEYRFYFEIGEHVNVPGYIGVYIYGLGESYPISLAGTVLSFAGESIVYTEEDKICGYHKLSYENDEHSTSKGIGYKKDNDMNNTYCFKIVSSILDFVNYIKTKKQIL